VRIGLHANPHKPAALALARRALGAIGDRAEVVLSDELSPLEPGRPHAAWESLGADVLLAIGGDGTFLHALRRTAVPLLPVNAGTLGVLSEVDGAAPGALEAALEKLLAGRYFLEERTKLAAEIGAEPLPDATNEYVVHATQVGKMGLFEISFDRRPVGTIRADGLIVATPTGSTAYALSSLGPIVEPEVDGFVLTAIAPFRVEARAVVLGGLRTVQIRSLRDGGSTVVLPDGDGEHPLAVGDAVTISRSPRRASLVRFGTSFFDRLKGKRILPWREDDPEGGPGAVLPPPP
jgi:NAD+ kinase